MDNLRPQRFPNEWLMSYDPIMFLPSLAEKIGVNEAIILQQIHFLITNKLNENIKNGRVWACRSNEKWMEKLPFWSYNEIMKIISSLERKKLLISCLFNEESFDKTKSYTIDYEEVECLDICLGGFVNG